MKKTSFSVDTVEEKRISNNHVLETQRAEFSIWKIDPISLKHPISRNPMSPTWGKKRKKEGERRKEETFFFLAECGGETAENGRMLDS